MDSNYVSCLSKLITSANMAEDELILTFDDGQKLKIYDDGQSCCEYRHMTTDDDLQSLVGGRLMSLTSKSGPDEDAGDSVHETCFVEVQTDKGFITITNHNEHNGYYGGFALRTKIV